LADAFILLERGEVVMAGDHARMGQDDVRQRLAL
jgi:ABC-type Na+ transport system ATPase subunit NatA